MTWWGVLLWFGAMSGLNFGIQFWVQRVKLRRGLETGRVVVSARDATTASGRSDRRWRVHRVTRESGRLLLRRSTDHPTETGVALYAAVDGGRPVRGTELLWTVVGADRAVVFQSSAGSIEIAAPDQVLDWITDELAAADPT